MGKKELSNREIRRRRRIKSQIMAYSVLVVLLVVLAAAGFFGVRAVMNYIEDYNQKVEQALVEAQTQTETEPESDENASQEMTQTQEEVEQEPQPDPLDELVEALLQDMTLEEKIAGMFMVSPEAITGVGKAVRAGESTKTAIQENPVGGLLYTQNNFQSKEQFQEMLSNTRGYSKYPLFLAVNAECGTSQTYAIEETPKASEIASADEAGTVYHTIAQGLASYGINMNLAPVADVVSQEGNAALQGRTFGSDAATAVSMVNASVLALQEQEVSAVLTKFPGEGSAVDGIVSKSLEELKNSDFITYQAAIQSGVDCIMVSNVKAPTVIGDNTPSSLSAVMITEVLRDTLGFQGVVMTDMLDDAAITAFYSEAQAAVAAIQAGADLLVAPADYEKAYEGVLQAVTEGTITEERIQESLYRIYRVKYKNTMENLQ